MAKSSYIQGNDNAFSAQMKIFRNNIGGYAATVGVSAAEVTAQADDSDYLEYVLKCTGIMANVAQQASALVGGPLLICCPVGPPPNHAFNDKISMVFDANGKRVHSGRIRSFRPAGAA